MRRDIMTTGDIAEYCHVSQTTVWKWIQQGRLKAYKLPSGHHRVKKQSFYNFLIEYQMPIDEDFFSEPINDPSK